jgi:hypothetical protein
VELSGSKLASEAEEDFLQNNIFRMTLPPLEVGGGRDYTLSVFLTDPSGRRTPKSAFIAFYVWPDHSWVRDVHSALGHGLSIAVAGQMATFTILSKSETVLSKSRDLMSPTKKNEFTGGERDGAGGDRYGGGGQDAPPRMLGQAMNVGTEDTGGGGGESYLVTLQGPSIVVGAVEFVGDGRYKGSFFVAEPGRYKA